MKKKKTRWSFFVPPGYGQATPWDPIPARKRGCAFPPVRRQKRATLGHHAWIVCAFSLPKKKRGSMSDIFFSRSTTPAPNHPRFGKKILLETKSTSGGYPKTPFIRERCRTTSLSDFFTPVYHQPRKKNKKTWCAHAPPFEMKKERGSRGCVRGGQHDVVLLFFFPLGTRALGGSQGGGEGERNGTNFSQKKKDVLGFSIRGHKRRARRRGSATTTHRDDGGSCNRQNRSSRRFRRQSKRRAKRRDWASPPRAAT